MITLDNGMQVGGLIWPVVCPVCGKEHEVEYRTDAAVPNPLPEKVEFPCSNECAFDGHLSSLAFE